MSPLSLLSPLALAVVAAPAAAQQFQQQPGMIPGTFRWTEGVECADVDQDGDLDVFFADGDGFSVPGTQRQNVLVINKLIENGSLSFQDESVARLGVHISHARGVSTGDLTGDGWVDALYANAFNTDPPFLYINQGAGSPGFFTEQAAARGLTSVLSSAGSGFGDLDNDGDLDVILCDSGASFLGGSGGKPHLYRNDGTGNFTEITGAAWNPSTKRAHMDVQLVDIDNDFDLDMVGVNRATNSGGNHYLMINDGTGSFTESSGTLASTSGNSYEAEVGDLDGDNDKDLFFVSLSGFSEGAMRNNLVPTTTLSFTNQPTLPLSQDDNEIVLIDYDNDRDFDVLVGSLATQERLWRNDGSLAFTAQHSQITAISDPTLDATAADLDNDGDYDIITANGEGGGSWENKVFLNTGSADPHAPLIIDEQVPAALPAAGPWVALGKIRDQVLDDGKTWVTGTARYVVNPAPVLSAVSIDPGAMNPSNPSVAVGTTVVWTNNSGVDQSVTSITTPYSYDSGTISNGATYQYTFVSPGTYTYRSITTGLVGMITVTGVPQEVEATDSGGGIFRFAMTGTAGGTSELAYELAFVDYNGNLSVSLSHTLQGTEPGTGSCFGVGCPCANDDPSAGCATSTGSGALLSGSGSTSAGSDDLVLTATGVPPNNNGLFYMGDTVVANAFYDGFQCALGTTFRFLNSIQGSGASGIMSHTGFVAESGLITAGTTWHFHAWFRDVPGTPCGTGANLTNLYSVTFTP